MRVRHVLIVRLDSEGDVLLAGPAVRAAATHAERVTLLVGPRGRQAAELLPGADRIVVHRAPWIDPEPAPVSAADTAALVGGLHGDLPDAAVVLTSFHQSALPLALLLRLAGVRRIAAVSEDYPGSLLDVRHRCDDDIHEVERSLGLMEAAGLPLPEDDDGRLRVRHLPGEPLPALPARYVVVHPGASVSARAWAPRRNRALVRALRRRGHAVVVTGGPGEEALTRHVAGGDALDLGGRTSLSGLARILAGADALAVGNTGPAHLAAAVGCPVAWLHAPTVPEVRWHPWRVPYVRLGGMPPCAGCRARVCPVPGHPCIDDVAPQEAADAVEALLARAATGRREAACAS